MKETRTKQLRKVGSTVGVMALVILLLLSLYQTTQLGIRVNQFGEELGIMSNLYSGLSENYTRLSGDYAELSEEYGVTILDLEESQEVVRRYTGNPFTTELWSGQLQAENITGMHWYTYFAGGLENRSDLIANPVNTASYIIETDGTNYWMTNTSTGQRDATSAVVSNIISWAIGNSSGGTVYINNVTGAYGFISEVGNLLDNHSVGTYMYGQAGEALTIGEMVYMETDGDYNLVDANSSATMPTIAAAAMDIANTEWGLFLVNGVIRADYIYGDIPIGPTVPMYVSWTAGEITSDDPNTSGDQVQIIGYGVAFGTLRFDPDSTVVEIS